MILAFNFDIRAFLFLGDSNISQWRGVLFLRHTGRPMSYNQSLPYPRSKNSNSCSESSGQMSFIKIL